MVYSLEDILGSNTTFDPLQLGIDVTPEAVKEACEKKEYLLALTVCDISPPFFAAKLHCVCWFYFTNHFVTFFKVKLEVK